MQPYPNRNSDQNVGCENSKLARASSTGAELSFTFMEMTLESNLSEQDAKVAVANVLSLSAFCSMRTTAKAGWSRLLLSRWIGQILSL